jgi:hypothetical protein
MRRASAAGPGDINVSSAPVESWRSRQDPGRADALLDETAQAVEKASGWHAWKWDMRLSQARAELAFARGAWREAIEAATHVIDQSRSRHRPKYEALALVTRARAGRELGSRSARRDAWAAVVVGRRLADPAVLLDCLIALLAIDGTDVLLDEARRTAQKIVGAVSDETLRSAFLTSVAHKAPGVCNGLTGCRPDTRAEQSPASESP